MYEYFPLLSCMLLVESCGDFYWRDYSGRIPSDAIPAGNNTNGLSYIGQVYIHKIGLGLGTLLPNTLDIMVPCYGRVITSNIMIKILCSSNQSKFHWLPTTAKTFKKDVREQCPILGGYDRKAWEMRGTLGQLNVGRTRKYGDVIVGPIAAYEEADAWFYHALNGSEKQASDFEVLVYRGDPMIENFPKVKEVSWS